MTLPQKFHIHLVSDSTGDTIYSLTRACLSQFDGLDVTEHFWNLVRTDRQLDLVLENIKNNPGLVLYTLVDSKLRNRLQDLCREVDAPYVSVLDPLINEMSLFFGSRSQGRPGRQYILNEQYYSRIGAIEYFLAHDDGQITNELYKADIIIVGVSRTSKTPTCMYLANRGFLAANFPYVPNCPLPQELFEVKKPLIVGLTKDADSLVEIRKTRLRMMNQSENTTYVDPEKVKEELVEAKRFFMKNKWPMIDVSKRSIEETAAEIIVYLQRRQAKIEQEKAQKEQTEGVGD